MPASEATLAMASFNGNALAVLPVRSQRVQAIHRGQNARADRYRFALQSIRISAAIPFLVMSTHDRHHRIRKIHLLQNLRPNDRMDFHLLEFFRRELARLRDNVLRHRQLANVVQHRGRRSASVSSSLKPSSLASSMA